VTAPAAPAAAAASAPAAAVEPTPATPAEPGLAVPTEPAATAAPAASGLAATTEQAVAPDPMAALDPADRAVAEKVRDRLAAASDKIFASKQERTAVEAFYQKRNFQPLWVDKGVENARASA